MLRFNISGSWYDAADYKTARAMHAAQQSGAATPEAPKHVATPKVVSKPKLVPTPQAVTPLPAVSTPVLTPVSALGLASGLTLYRGDERAADVIARDGFQLWGDAVAAVSAAGGIAEFILHKLYNAYANERDIERYIVTGKNRARPTISTSRNDGCGGYDSGNIYRIQYATDELQEYVFDDVMKAYSPAAAGSKFPKFRLYMDRPDIKNARQIALDLNIPTEEVVFFRHAPGDRIVHYKPKGSASFLPMPTAAARAKLW